MFKTEFEAADGLGIDVISIDAKQTQRHAPGICIAMSELKNEAWSIFGFLVVQPVSHLIPTSRP